jgi:polysaccharide biosynthesis/export protein
MNLALIRRLTLPFLLFSLFLSSCVSKKDMVYFQGNNDKLNVPVKYELKYKPDDLLTISVSALDLDAVRPFNLYIANGSSIEANITSQLQPLLVDVEGNIDFPVIGRISIAGLTRNEATRLIIDKLRPYVIDPIVNIRLINFKISVLGEVRSPGSFTIQNERVTLPEALSLANDLRIQGQRANVMVIREVNGRVTKNYIDLRTNALFSSPYYYLQQNDVVYVEPNNAKIKSSTYNQYTSITISALSTLISIYAILFR